MPSPAVRTVPWDPVTVTDGTDIPGFSVLNRQRVCVRWTRSTTLVVMPAVSTTLRMLSVSVIASLTVTGCQTLDDAGRALGRSDLVNDLAARMDGALTATWAADYQLPGGRTASVAQTKTPLRSAYTWPDGKITVTQESVTRCETSAGRTACTVLPPELTAGKPSVLVWTEAEKRGLVTPPAVMGLLTDAALDPDAVITQSDTTVAGHHATCVDVKRSTGDFSTCVTTEGVLGSFSGTLAGTPTEVTLSRYTESVDPAAFDVPAGAGVVDRRTVTP
ncbi:hypothetical protein GA0070560_103249 [Micromonospora halophytica]|uniref:Lipoprotein n=2 Tax=Micromonospora halophytica TaxID=47864 RepID=A0A1C5H7X1_9ACTN|nr:hypothetical protein GA0070560_103249 [Micromonospora halophytica]